MEVHKSQRKSNEVNGDRETQKRVAGSGEHEEKMRSEASEEE